MGKDRLKRVLILLVLIAFLLVGGKVFADWNNKRKAAGEEISLPLKDISTQINNFGEEVLGNAISVIPGSNDLKEKILKEPTPTVTGSFSSSSQEVSEAEESESKTETIIQILKELPAEQLDKVKKQIFKDFCQQILEE